MTAIKIVYMYKVQENHDLVTKIVYLYPYTMALTLESVKAAITEKIKLCLFAFLFGINYDIALYSVFFKASV